jgi:hypothetical protein
MVMSSDLRRVCSAILVDQRPLWTTIRGQPRVAAMFPADRAVNARQLYCHHATGWTCHAA